MVNRVIKDLLYKEVPFVLSSAAIIWVLALLGLPLGMMIFNSLYDPQAAQFSLQHYQHFFDILYFKVLLRSLILALSTVVCTTVIAYPVAYFIALRADRYKNILLFLITLPFWTNFIVQVYAWFFILEKQGMLNTFLLNMRIIREPIQFAYTTAAVLLLMVYCYVPFMIMPLYILLQKCDKYLLEASMDLGATRWQTFMNITLPLSVPGIRTGMILVFVPAFGEFVIPSLIGGSKTMTIGGLVAHYFLEVHDPLKGAAFTIIASLLLIISVLMMMGMLHYYETSRR